MHSILLSIDWHMVLIKAGQLILALSILVILHEFGHYITARWFGCRVEKFYLFFDPWFSLFKKKIGDTEYGIGWLPLGGYVKISGMIDESMDTEAMKKEPQSWEFRSKPAWQRLIIMLGGIIMNVIVAIVIYSLVLFTYGKDVIPPQSVKYGIAFQDSLYFKIGFQNGDKLIAVNGKTIDNLDDAAMKVMTGKSATVERNGKSIELQFPENLIETLIESKKRGPAMQIIPRMPAMIGSMADIGNDSPGKQAGLQEGDLILSINNQPIRFFDEMRSVLVASTEPAVALEVLRKNDTLHLRSSLTKEKKLGIPPISDIEKLQAMGVLNYQHKTYTLAACFPAGLQLTVEKLQSYIDQFKMMLQPKTGAYKGLGGFKAIANAFPAIWNWEAFWNITAFLSIVLAFMNLLPIPALDGGHVMFTLYEMITRRKPSEKFLEYAQVVGMVLLLSLMLYANANDWLGWGK